MAPWEKDTWHKRHVVWRVPPRTLVHVTTWTIEKVTHGKMNSRMKGSYLKEIKQSSGCERKRKGKRKEEKKERKEKKKERKKRASIPGVSTVGSR